MTVITYLLVNCCLYLPTVPCVNIQKSSRNCISSISLPRPRDGRLLIGTIISQPQKLQNWHDRVNNFCNCVQYLRDSDEQVLGISRWDFFTVKVKTTSQDNYFVDRSREPPLSLDLFQSENIWHSVCLPACQALLRLKQIKTLFILVIVLVAPEWGDE